VGGYLPSAPGVSTVRYPIPQRTFKYVATVQSVTDETCQFRTSAADEVMMASPEVSQFSITSAKRPISTLLLRWTRRACSGQMA
jgi:hypothetical protein